MNANLSRSFFCASWSLHFLDSFDSADLLGLVGSLDITRAAEIDTMDTAASRIFETRMDTSDTLDSGVVSETTVVVTQSRVELPLFPGQPLELPLHRPFLQALHC